DLWLSANPARQIGLRQAGALPRPVECADERVDGVDLRPRPAVLGGEVWLPHPFIEVPIEAGLGPATHLAIPRNLYATQSKARAQARQSSATREGGSSYKARDAPRRTDPGEPRGVC